MKITRLLFLCLVPLFYCQILAAQRDASPASATNPSSCHDASFVASSGNNFRGDGECGATFNDDGGGGIDVDTRDVILRFLDCTTKRDEIVEEDDRPFHIQGWRWHSMSLIRDSRRLERLSRHLANITKDRDDEESSFGFEALERAANYVINFNMAGLFRIQSVFLNFLRKHLCDEESLGLFSEGENYAAEADAFRKLIDAIDKGRDRSEHVGRQLYDSANASSKSSESFQNKQRLLGEVARSSRRLVDLLASMRKLQETLIVPAISRVIPSKVQKSFNSKVLLSLGLLESRLHLVGMYDTVWESEIEAEKVKFEKEIPYVARMMIERWRQSLYIPKAGALDYGLSI
ncbi:hypothetical protein ACHAW5_004487 [Stephanodiscus triporus]|uniref:Uncharacterized protein n=1 Tax=Stephanodiscus triporus TaxID=2934178 RepID=A0ABD3Q5V9_9STRA